MLDTNVLYDLYTNSDRFELVSSVITGQMCCISYSVYLELFMRLCIMYNSTGFYRFLSFPKF